MTSNKTIKIKAKHATSTEHHSRVKGWAKKASSRYTRRTTKQALNNG